MRLRASCVCFLALSACGVAGQSSDADLLEEQVEATGSAETTLLTFSSASTTANTDATDKSGGFSQLNTDNAACKVGSYADCWNYYIEFSPSYSGYFTF